MTTPSARTTARPSAQVGLIAWDHKFEDNAGFYKVIVRITQGPASVPLPPVD